MRSRIAICLFLVASAAAGDPLTSWLRVNGQRPQDYVLSKLTDHRIVIVGEPHTMRYDVELVTSLVPELHRRGVALAAEFYGAADQAKIDALVNAPEWSVANADAIMRDADWPFVQYRDILQAAWKTNRDLPDLPPLKVIALSPGQDWRKELLPKGIGYDQFMAERVTEQAVDEQHRILVYCGTHHAFTRYYQADRLDAQGRAMRFMDRFGNILYRRFGQEVFMVALHKTEWAGPPEKPTATNVLPFRGVIDCAAAPLDRPVAFDVAGSPLQDLRFPSDSYYAYGHPALRFADFTDGYIYLMPVDRFRYVDLIPLEEYAPDRAGDPKMRERWQKRTVGMSDPSEQWKQLAGWREQCR